MSSIGKIFVVLNLVFSLIVLGVVGAILSKSDEFKTKYTNEASARAADKTAWESDKATLEKDKSSLQLDIRTKEETITRLETNNKSLEGDNGKLQADLDTLKGDLAKLQADYSKFTTSVESLRALNESLAKENGEMRDAKHAAEQKQSAAEADLARANKQIETLTADIEQLKAQIDNANAAVSDARMQIEAAIQAGFDISKVRAQPQIDAVVESVNTNLNLVILSVGSDDGVARGTKFSVHGNGQYKGEVVVDDLYPDHAAARIVPSATGKGGLIAAGDKATTRL